jgi:hypothetical protein
MASLDDILTVQKNGVVAINSLNATAKLIEADLPCICTNLGLIVTALQTIAENSTPLFPALTSETIAASTTHLEVVGAGKLYAVSIPTHSGANSVFIYDSATTAGISAANLIYGSLKASEANFLAYETISMAYKNGLVIETESNMTCCVSYTPNQ